MITIDKLDEKSFAVTVDDGPRRVYLEPFYATSLGDQVVIRSQVSTADFRGDYKEFAIDGVTHDSAEATVRALVFLGNFKRGGSSSLTTQEKTVTITENGEFSVTPDVGFDALSKVNLNVNVAGGGGANCSDPVLFFDFDGTLLYSYTIAEAQALTELPGLPTHDLLTGDGWTHSLEEVHNVVGALHVGAQYRTTDGKTHAWVMLTPVSGLALPICFTVTGVATIRVDWGDGQTQDVTTTSTLTHNYAGSGNYEITLERIAGTGSYTLGRGSSSTVFIGANTDGYRQTLTRVFIGDSATIGNYAFRYCYSLSSVVIPSGVTSIGTDAFGYAYSLFAIVISSGVTHIGTSSFSNSYLRLIVISPNVTHIDNYAFNNSTLSSIVISSSTESIGVSAFYSAWPLNDIIFKSEIPPSLGNADVFAYGTTIRKIYVPDKSVEAYKTATNWATYANYIYPISQRIAA